MNTHVDIFRSQPTSRNTHLFIIILVILHVILAPLPTASTTSPSSSTTASVTPSTCPRPRDRPASLGASTEALSGRIFGPGLLVLLVVRLGQFLAHARHHTQLQQAVNDVEGHVTDPGADVMAEDGVESPQDGLKGKRTVRFQNPLVWIPTGIVLAEQ